MKRRQRELRRLEVEQRVDADAGPGAVGLAHAVIGHHDHFHSGGERRFHAVRRILEHENVLGTCGSVAEALGAHLKFHLSYFHHKLESSPDAACRV